MYPIEKGEITMNKVLYALLNVYCLFIHSDGSISCDHISEAAEIFFSLFS